MSGYPQKWHASTNHDDKSGEAVYTVDGKEYRMRLQRFEDFQAVSEMLGAAFKQGKHFAAVAMRGHVERALETADQSHAL